MIEGGAQERGRRAGTENIAGICSMAAALKESVSNMEKNSAKLIPMRDRLIEGLSEIPHSIVNGSRASSGSACTSGSLDPSHVLLAIGRPHEVAHGSLRISLSEENTPDQIEFIIKSVKEVVEYLRSISPVWHDLQEGKRKYVIQ